MCGHEPSHDDTTAFVDTGCQEVYRNNLLIFSRTKSLKEQCITEEQQWSSLSDVGALVCSLYEYIGDLVFPLFDSRYIKHGFTPWELVASRDDVMPDTNSLILMSLSLNIRTKLSDWVSISDTDARKMQVTGAQSPTPFIFLYHNPVTVR